MWLFDYFSDIRINVCLYAAKESCFSFMMTLILNETVFQMSAGGNRKMSNTASEAGSPQDMERARALHLC